MSHPLCFYLSFVLVLPGFSRAAEVHQHDRIRVHYETTGPHAADPKDENQNEIPDQVENLLLQTRGAWLLWIDTLDFPNPFESPRFKTASFLDIHLRSKDTLKSNGVAYDELQRFRKPSDPPDTLSISFAVATSVDPTQNLTPAHELFHLIQNGATFFKNRWYTEGTARWSEKGLGQGALGTGLRGTWPPTPATLERLDTLAYDACPQFWEPFLLSLDTPCVIPADRIPPELTALRYTDGSPVLKDHQLHGWPIIRRLLQELTQADDTAYTERHLTRWSEEEQRSPKNTPHIHRALKNITSSSPAPPPKE
jgi:hypothetical protein